MIPKPETDIDRQALVLCEQKREIDDRLGSFSDHEGDVYGPTWFLWKSKTLKQYSKHIDYAIEQHSRAIGTLIELRNLKEKSK